MKYLFILLIALLLCAMFWPKPEHNQLDRIMQQQQAKSISTPVENPKGISVIVVDGCEYVVYDYGDAGGITHKGNCKYCKNKYQ